MASLFSATGIRVAATAQDARKACDSDAGVPGVRSWSVMHLETTDLSKLPTEVEKKVRSQAYHNVAVGACRASEAAGFTRYRIALIFF